MFPASPVYLLGQGHATLINKFFYKLVPVTVKKVFCVNLECGKLEETGNILGLCSDLVSPVLFQHSLSLKGFAVRTLIWRKEKGFSVSVWRWWRRVVGYFRAYCKVQRQCFVFCLQNAISLYMKNFWILLNGHCISHSIFGSLYFLFFTCSFFSWWKKWVNSLSFPKLNYLKCHLRFLQ